MCGIVGLFLKDKSLQFQLGALLSGMLVTLTDRGPDSAGIAAALVNWLPWSVLKMSGRPNRASASSSAAPQNRVSMLLDSRHASTVNGGRNLGQWGGAKDAVMGLAPELSPLRLVAAVEIRCRCPWHAMRAYGVLPLGLPHSEHRMKGQRHGSVYRARRSRWQALRSAF